MVDYVEEDMNLLADRIAFKAFKQWPPVSLVEVTKANPFEAHPALRTIWTPERRYTETD